VGELKISQAGAQISNFGPDNVAKNCLELAGLKTRASDSQSANVMTTWPQQPFVLNSFTGYEGAQTWKYENSSNPDSSNYELLERTKSSNVELVKQAKLLNGALGSG